MFSKAYRLSSNGIWTRPDREQFNYSDGEEVETRILDQIRECNDISLASDELQQKMVDWPSEYHFSPLRSNLLAPFTLESFDSILEIGSGCGAITRQLGEKCKQSKIIALEGSPRRAEITHARCRDLSHVQVCSDSFTSFEHDESFDLITLIGVLEYSPSFYKSDNPILDTLKKAISSLSDGGMLIIAIENQLGLKYFNGATEDHTGTPFTGINDLYKPATVKTLGRVDLLEVIKKAGFEHVEFVYPFPDYKLPQLLLREKSFEEEAFDESFLLGQYPARDYGFDNDKFLLENRVWRLISQNKLTRDLANSFLIFASKGSGEFESIASPWLAKAYSGRRKKKYLIETEFSKKEGNIVVTKKLLYPDADYTKVSETIRHHLHAAPYISGTPYTANLQQFLSFNDPFEQFIKYLTPWVNWLQKVSIKSDQAGSKDQLIAGEYYDCMPANFILGSEEELTIIDQEWESKTPLTLGFVFFRGLYREIAGNIEFFEQVDLFVSKSIFHLVERIFAAFDLPFSHKIYENYLELEANFQLEVVPYTVDAKGLQSHLDEFFKKKRSKRSTIAQFLVDGGVEHYDHLQWQKDTLHEETAQLGAKYKALDDEFKQLNYLADKHAKQQEKRAKQHEQIIEDRDKHIGDLCLDIMQKEKDIEDLHYICSVRESTIAEMENSSSWKVTAPLRLSGFLLKGDTENAKRLSNEMWNNLIRFPVSSFHKQWEKAGNRLETETDSQDNLKAIQTIVDQRCEVTASPLCNDPLSALVPETLPAVDITIVTYNSQKWISDFSASLKKLKYPKEFISLYFIDNGSSDETVKRLEQEKEQILNQGFSKVEIIRESNRGYGAGHTVGLKRGNAPFCLVTNIDLTFEKDALSNVVATALTDVPEVAAWELRQIPYEHPKFYDPVTGLTNWNSHACILFRRSSLEQVQFYDENLFMYGEDVELSYRLRAAGFFLKYCPSAVVNHYSYDHAGEIKPIQYSGSTFANLYLRKKYGNSQDKKAISFMAHQLLSGKPPYPGARKAVLKNILKLQKVSFKNSGKVKAAQDSSSIYFPFRHWDYELVRNGAFISQLKLTGELPKVSIITRTYQGRDLFLRQALLSVAHQTYGNIEHIIVEDGGNSMEQVVAEITAITNHNTIFIANEKLGRSSAGNAGLANSSGRWCLFLDDDDLLFADHIETLVTALLNNSEASAAYSESWEVETNFTGLPDGKYLEMNHTVPEVLQEDYNYKSLQHHNLMAIQAVLFERALYEQRGGFDNDLDVLEDWVLWVCYGYEKQFVKVPRVTSLYRTPYDKKIRQNRQDLIDQGYQIAVERARRRIEEFTTEESGGDSSKR